VKIVESEAPQVERVAGKVAERSSVTVAPCSVTLLRFEAE